MLIPCSLQADYPFDEEDSEHNIIFTPETADQSRPAVKAAKLEKLIERLTYEKYPGFHFASLLASFLQPWLTLAACQIRTT